MNGMQKLAVICLLVSASSIGLWTYKGITGGFKLATPEKVQVVKKVVDEFGDEEEEVKWVKNPDRFDIGLDLAGPISGLFGFLAFGLYFYDRRRQVTPE